MLLVFRPSLRLVLGLLILLIGAERACSETLREALAGKHLPVAGAKLANLDKNITSGAELDDAKQFVIAYYGDDGSGLLNHPLFLDRYDRKHEEWTSTAINGVTTDGPDSGIDCTGSVLGITAAGSRLLLDTHLNPSAGCLLVLSPELKLEAGLYGWLVGRLGADVLIYHRSQVHFAPVHPAEIALYDLRSKRDVTLFPPKPDPPIRQARTLQLKDFYNGNEDWCNKNNDPCDPQHFDSALQGPVVTSEPESALAFLISYEQIQFVQGDVQKPSGPKDVLYLCRRVDDEAKMKCREMLLEEAKMQFGDVPLQNLLQPEVLQKLFGEASPKRP